MDVRVVKEAIDIYFGGQQRISIPEKCIFAKFYGYVSDLFFFFELNNYFINKTKKPVTKQANSKELISYTVSYTKVYKLRNSRWEKKQSKRKL